MSLSHDRSAVGDYDRPSRAISKASGPQPGMVFFAIRPDIAATARIEAVTRQLRSEHRLTSDPLKSENLHISLLPVGRYPLLIDKTVKAACDAASSMAARSFEVVF